MGGLNLNELKEKEEPKFEIKPIKTQINIYPKWNTYEQKYYFIDDRNIYDDKKYGEMNQIKPELNNKAFNTYNKNLNSNENLEITSKLQNMDTKIVGYKNW